MKFEVLQLSKILIPEVLDHLNALFTVHRLYEQEDPQAFLKEVGPRISAVITGGHTGITNEVFDALPNLKLITVNGVGTDAIDLNHVRQRGNVYVAATIGALTEDVADLAVGLLIDVCRRISYGDKFVKQGLWPKSENTLAPYPLNRQVSGLKVGIVGLGRVGRAVATRLDAFGCPIQYTDIVQIPDVKYEYVDQLVDLAKQSEVLIVAAAADKDQGIINAQVLEALGPEGYLINIARGKLVNEDDLVAALEQGKIAGAGLDVFVNEPHVPEFLLNADNVVLLPHRASATVQTRTKMGMMVVDSLIAVLQQGQQPEGCVLKIQQQESAVGV